jgi:hypothetical protein
MFNKYNSFRNEDGMRERLKTRDPFTWRKVYNIYAVKFYGCKFF